jgi:predicted esterase
MARNEMAGYAIFHGGLAAPDGQSWSSAGPPRLIMHGGADAAPPIS